MVKHIVVYKLKEGVDKAEAVRIARESVEPLVGKIPGLLHLEAKTHFSHFIETRTAADYEF